MNRAIRFSCWLLVVVAACLPATPTPPVVHPSHTRVAAASTRLDDATSDPLMRHWLKRLEQTRGLRLRAVLSVKRLSPTAFIEEAIGRSWAREDDIDQDEIELVAWGLIPPTAKLQELTRTLLSHDLAGFYDVRSGTIFLPEIPGTPPDEETIAHELVHALQDQNFQLRRRMFEEPISADRLLVMKSLAEGEALAVGIALALQEQQLTLADVDVEALLERMLESLKESVRVDGVPPALRRSQLATYTVGLRAVLRVLEHGGWQSMNRTWNKPPQSSLEMMFPDRSHPNENVTVSPPAWASSMKIRDEDVLGALSLQLLLEEWTSPEHAHRLASYWKGDRRLIFQGVSASGEQTFAVLWKVTFAPDASGMCIPAGQVHAVIQTLAIRHGAHSVTNDVCVERKDLPTILARRVGCEWELVSVPFIRNANGIRAVFSCEQLSRLR